MVRRNGEFIWVELDYESGAVRFHSHPLNCIFRIPLPNLVLDINTKTVARHAGKSISDAHSSRILESVTAFKFIESYEALRTNSGKYEHH